jgi:hypothetical protein
LYCLFMLKEFLFFNHHSHLGEFFVIHFFVGRCQGDLFIKSFFAMAHFHALWWSVTFFPSCIFHPLNGDIHIICPIFVIPLIFEHFVFYLAFVGFVVQPCKCMPCSPCGLPPSLCS